jgi:hypothetical protein
LCTIQNTSKSGFFDGCEDLGEKGENPKDQKRIF